MVQLIKVIVLFFIIHINAQNKYPSWPSPYSWNGTFSFYDPVNVKGDITICYNAEKQQFSKAFHVTSNSSDIFTSKFIFLGTKQYVICYGPSDCWGTAPNTCKNSTHPTFPYPINQFENYTNVGEETVHHSRNVFHYVGSSPFGFDTDQYFYTESNSNKYPGYPAGNIMIAEPGWTTEVRWFDEFSAGTNQDACFALISSCNTNY
eukprot:UN12976